MKNSAVALFSSSLVVGVCIAVSSSSWFGVWLGLELNLLSFIPLILMESKESSEVEAGLKYFLIQACGSLILLQSSVFLSSWVGLAGVMTSAALGLKLGIAPFHFWFPMVAEGLQWTKLYILSTVQKIGPMVLFYYSVSKMTNLLFMVILLTGIIGAVGGINESSLRKLFSYSSINHMAWVLLGMFHAPTVWVSYFVGYILVLASVVSLLNMKQLYHLGQVVRKGVSGWTRMTLIIGVMSLGGLPPLLGFLPKWIIIQATSSSAGGVVTFGLLMTSVVTLYYYLRAGLAITLSTMKLGELSDEKLEVTELTTMVMNLSGLVVLGSVWFSISQ